MKAGDVYGNNFLYLIDIYLTIKIIKETLIQAKGKIMKVNLALGLNAKHNYMYKFIELPTNNIRLAIDKIFSINRNPALQVKLLSRFFS